MAFGRQVFGDQRGQPDSQVHVGVRAQLSSRPPCHLPARPPHDALFTRRTDIRAHGRGTRGSGDPLLDIQSVIDALEDALHEDSWSVDRVRVDLSGFQQFLDLDDGAAGGHGHQRGEAAGRLAIDEIALTISLPSLDHGEISRKGRLQEAGAPSELHDRLALGDGGPHPGRREEGRDPRAGSPHPFGKGALRVQVDLHLAVEDLSLQIGVAPDVGPHETPDLVALQQPHQAFALVPAVVAHHRQLTDVATVQLVDAVLGDAAQPETAEHDGRAILDVPKRFARSRADLVLHGRLTSSGLPPTRAQPPEEPSLRAGRHRACPSRPHLEEPDPSEGKRRPR